MNPGKTGVFDFRPLVRTGSDYALQPISSSFLRRKAYWDVLSRCSIEVGVFAYPVMHPPYPVNAFMVTGVGLQEATFAYPTELVDRIEKITGGYEPSVNYHVEKYDDINLL